MSDPTIPMLKRIKEVFESKREALDAVITHIAQTIALLENDGTLQLEAHTPPATKREAPVRKAKVQRAFGAGKSASRIPDEQIIDAAIGLIRKGGPLMLTTITKGIKKVYPKLKGGIGVALRAEEKRTGGRVARDASGRWIETADVKRVVDKRTPEEVAAAFAKAKANNERQVEAA